MDRRHFLTAGAGIGALAFADKLWALKYYPMPSDKRCAVLYSTWCGSARDAAVWISEGMGGIADVYDVREEPDLSGFDHIILGGAIRFGVTAMELQEYISTNKEWLHDKVRGLFAVCGNRSGRNRLPRSLRTIWQNCARSAPSHRTSFWAELQSH
ncbi:hypothetical protein JW998_00825 [candidate division KSB1 bacterium]|nr:hypothetical protein [candidate division KSB1 bacterium]